MYKPGTAKCYGGDISCKNKLLEKQKEGRGAGTDCGTVNNPQEVFVALRIGEE